MKEVNKVTETVPNEAGVDAAGREGALTRSVDPRVANAAVIREVSSWQGVTVHEHRFGGVEFRIGRRELGHLHARFADLPFPPPIRNALISQGKARPHHVLPDSGWVTVPMRRAAEITNVISLFRQNYERTRNAGD